MQSKQEYALQNLIQRATKNIGVILRRQRKKGATLLCIEPFQATPSLEITKISEDFRTMIIAMQSQKGNGNDNAKRLFNLSFGKRTRFNKWLTKQRGEHADVLINLHAQLSALCIITPPADVIDLQAAPVVDPLQVFVNANTQHVSKLCLVVPFLQRIAESHNFNDKDRLLVQKFLDYFVNHRMNLISLKTELVTTVGELLDHDRKRAFFESQRSATDLACDYDKIASIIKRADAMNKTKGYGVFHWHLDGDVELCVNALNQLDRCQAEIKLINQMANTETKEKILEERQEITDRLLGERLTRYFIEKANPKGLGYVSVEGSKRDMAVAWIPCLANHWLGLPESLNQGFQRGSLETLLVTARPELFHDAPDNQCVMSHSSVLRDFDEILRGSGDPELQALLSIIAPYSTSNEVVTAYCSVIRSLASGQLQMNATPDWSVLARSKSRLEQARDMSERLLLYVAVNSLQGDLDTNNQLDQVAELLKFNKKDKVPGIDMIGDISKYPIQTLYHHRKEAWFLEQSHETTMAVLQSRVKQVDAKAIALFDSLADTFTKLRNPADAPDFNQVVSPMRIPHEVQILSHGCHVNAALLSKTVKKMRSDGAGSVDEGDAAKKGA